MTLSLPAPLSAGDGLFGNGHRLRHAAKLAPPSASYFIDPRRAARYSRHGRSARSRLVDSPSKPSAALPDKDATSPPEVSESTRREKDRLVQAIDRNLRLDNENDLALTRFMVQPLDRVKGLAGETLIATARSTGRKREGQATLITRPSTSSCASCGRVIQTCLALS
jgi:hypothetical protein